MDQLVNVAIGVLVEYREGQPWVLIARRKLDAVLGGYWELPGGKIEEGESPQVCLAREFEEELGVVVHVHDALAIIEFEYDHAHVRLFPFYCSPAPDSPAPRNLHVAEHRWVPASDLTLFQFPPANVTLIVEVRSALMKATT